MSSLPHSPSGRRAAPRPLPLPYWLAEFGRIRSAVLTALACLLLSTGALQLSHWRLNSAEDRLQLAQRTRDAAYTRYAHVDNEKRDIRNFQPRFVELRTRGLIGAEKRIEWVDAIRQVQEQRRLLPLSYEVEPQQTVQLAGALDLGDYQLQSSRMHLHMDLLHEMDLFNFLTDLHQRAFFAVQSCNIKRLARAVGAQGGPTLGADCTLNWVTLGTPAKAPAGNASAAASPASKETP
ncbi:hypothetical protein GTP23_20760 [Pseudoduganella sp. FT93W]|uniref:Uncharacterized protein n=1 Tax=Duganella fentianensis TaxID=2692177 RepID=A0A845I1Q9_9BURK|nr:hypothetical protein [Duganella fentianensis]MYN47480.1 hypothetical protein [Duganella fentianensis]